MTRPSTVRLRAATVLAAFPLLLTACALPHANATTSPSSSSPSTASTASGASATTRGAALTALERLPIKGRAAKTGYSRTKFGGTWASVGSCNERDKILARDLHNVTFKGHTCKVASGAFTEPYTGKSFHFVRGIKTSSLLQVDHTVALGSAWVTGAQQLTQAQREALYNDPLELLAVDGKQNDLKSDSDAASWLPPNKAYRCLYVARQVAVKTKYRLWVTQPEHDAIAKVLSTCPDQPLPTS